MAYENLRKEIAKLAEGIPPGFATFDADGKPVIDSDLATGEWVRAFLAFMVSDGHAKEKQGVVRQLRDSRRRVDGKQNLLCEYLYAVHYGVLPKEEQVF